MKRICIYYLFVCLLITGISSAQITTTTNFLNVACNHNSLGWASVTVTDSIHPPYVYNWSNGVTTSGQGSSSVNNLEIGTYTVTITDAIDADIGTATVTIGEDPCDVGPEPVFTPNGDLYNDTWFIDKAVFFSNAWILVYNRLGQKVYDHKGLYLNDWDGKDMFGAPLPDASYYYVIYMDKSDKSNIKKGCVSIVR